MFSIRLVSADHYMGHPIPGLDVEYSDFRGTEVKQVPVIRVFGSTITGKKTCLHIHGVFPYICIPYEGSGLHERLMYQIASSLDKALNISLGKASSTVQHVYKVALVSGVPFYGFHYKEHQYFKIYFYNPLMVKRATDLLQSGAILNKIYQPHEAHIPFILQFMIDYNIHGMNLVNLENIKVRRDPENPELFEIFPEELFLPVKVLKISSCALEVDATASDILNRRAISADLPVNPGLSAIWEDEKQRRREEGRTSQVTPQCSQERPLVTSTKSELFFKQKLREKLQAASLQLSGSSQSTNVTPDELRTPYPAETPEGSGLLEASFVDIHVQPSQSSTIVKSQHTVQDDDNSVVDEDLILSLSSQREPTLSPDESIIIDSQDVELAAMLQNLEGSANVDDDSVLGSQRAQESIHGDGDEEDDMQELSQPLDAAAQDKFEMGQQECDSRSLDSEDSSDSLWENTFWDNADNNIPQLDGADDVPEKPRCRRYGLRGRTIQSKPNICNSQKSCAMKPKPSRAKNLFNTPVPKSSSSCPNVEDVKLKENEEDFSSDRSPTFPEEVADAGVVDYPTVENCELSHSLVLSEGEGLTSESATMIGMLPVANEVVDFEGLEASVDCLVPVEDLPTDVFISNDVLNTGNVEDVSSVVPVNEEESLQSLVYTCSEFVNSENESSVVPVNGNENLPTYICSSCNNTASSETVADVSFVVPVVEDNENVCISCCVSDDISSLVPNIVEEIPTNISIHTDAVTSGSIEVAPSTVPVITNESAIFENLETDSASTVEETFAEVYQEGTLDVVDQFLECRNENTSSVSLLDTVNTVTDNRTLIFASESCTSDLVDEVFNTELNLQPTSVVCCKICSLLYTPQGSVQAMHINGTINRFEYVCEDCEDDSESPLIGDPSFTAEVLSESDDLEQNDLQVNSSNSSSPWLTTDQNSDSSKSSFLPELDTDLLSQYNTQTIQEVSLEKIFSEQEQKPKRGRGRPRKAESALQGRKQTSGRSCQSNNFAVSKIKSLVPVKKSLRSHKTNKCDESDTLSKLTLTVDTDFQPSVLFAAGTLSSCSNKTTMDVSPIEVKRIETLLWQGKIEEIIMNDSSAVAEAAENKIRKSRSRVRNGHQNNRTKKCDELKQCSGATNSVLSVSKRKKDVLAKVIHKNGINVRSSCSHLEEYSIAVAESNVRAGDVNTKKLVRRMQKEKRKKLSLTYKRKSTSSQPKHQKRREGQPWLKEIDDNGTAAYLGMSASQKKSRNTNENIELSLPIEAHSLKDIDKSRKLSRLSNSRKMSKVKDEKYRSQMKVENKTSSKKSSLAIFKGKELKQGCDSRDIVISNQRCKLDGNEGEKSSACDRIKLNESRARRKSPASCSALKVSVLHLDEHTTSCPAKCLSRRASASEKRNRQYNGRVNSSRVAAEKVTIVERANSVENASSIGADVNFRVDPIHQSKDLNETYQNDKSHVPNCTRIQDLIKPSYVRLEKIDVKKLRSLKLKFKQNRAPNKSNGHSRRNDKGSASKQEEEAKGASKGSLEEGKVPPSTSKKPRSNRLKKNHVSGDIHVFEKLPDTEEVEKYLCANKSNGHSRRNDNGSASKQEEEAKGASKGSLEEGKVPPSTSKKPLNNRLKKNHVSADTRVFEKLPDSEDVEKYLCAKNQTKAMVFFNDKEITDVAEDAISPVSDEKILVLKTDNNKMPSRTSTQNRSCSRKSKKRDNKNVEARARSLRSVQMKINAQIFTSENKSSYSNSPKVIDADTKTDSFDSEKQLKVVDTKKAAKVKNTVDKNVIIQKQKRAKDANNLSSQDLDIRPLGDNILDDGDSMKKLTFHEKSGLEVSDDQVAMPSENISLPGSLSKIKPLNGIVNKIAKCLEENKPEGEVNHKKLKHIFKNKELDSVSTRKENNRTPCFNLTCISVIAQNCDVKLSHGQPSNSLSVEKKRNHGNASDERERDGVIPICPSTDELICKKELTVKDAIINGIHSVSVALKRIDFENFLSTGGKLITKDCEDKLKNNFHSKTLAKYLTVTNAKVKEESRIAFDSGSSSSLKNNSEKSKILNSCNTVNDRLHTKDKLQDLSNENETNTMAAHCVKKDDKKGLPSRNSNKRGNKRKVRSCCLDGSGSTCDAPKKKFNYKHNGTSIAIREEDLKWNHAVHENTKAKDNQSLFEESNKDNCSSIEVDVLSAEQKSNVISGRKGTQVINPEKICCRNEKENNKTLHLKETHNNNNKLTAHQFKKVSSIVQECISIGDSYNKNHHLLQSDDASDRRLSEGEEVLNGGDESTNFHADYRKKLNVIETTSHVITPKCCPHVEFVVTTKSQDNDLELCDKKTCNSEDVNHPRQIVLGLEMEDSVSGKNKKSRSNKNCSSVQKKIVEKEKKKFGNAKDSEKVYNPRTMLNCKRDVSNDLGNEMSLTQKKKSIKDYIQKIEGDSDKEKHQLKRNSSDSSSQIESDDQISENIKNSRTSSTQMKRTANTKVHRANSSENRNGNSTITNDNQANCSNFTQEENSTILQNFCSDSLKANMGPYSCMPIFKQKERQVKRKKYLAHKPRHKRKNNKEDKNKNVPIDMSISRPKEIDSSLSKGNQSQKNDGLGGENQCKTDACIGRKQGNGITESNSTKPIQLCDTVIVVPECSSDKENSQKFENKLLTSAVLKRRHSDVSYSSVCHLYPQVTSKEENGGLKIVLTTEEEHEDTKTEPRRRIGSFCSDSSVRRTPFPLLKSSSEPVFQYSLQSKQLVNNYGAVLERMKYCCKEKDNKIKAEIREPSQDEAKDKTSTTNKRDSDAKDVIQNSSEQPSNSIENVKEGRKRTEAVNCTNRVLNGTQEMQSRGKLEKRGLISKLQNGTNSDLTQKQKNKKIQVPTPCNISGKTAFSTKKSPQILVKKKFAKNDCDSNSLHTEHRKFLKRKNKEVKSQVNGVINKKSDSLFLLKPLVVSLVRLEQSTLDKYNVMLPKTVSSNKSHEIVKQAVGNSLPKSKDISNPQLENLKKNKTERKRNIVAAIPSLDGEFETSSSEDSTESRSQQHLRQKILAKSPSGKKPRTRHSKAIKEKLKNSQDDDLGASSLQHTPVKKQLFIIPPKELKRDSVQSPLHGNSPIRSPRKSAYPPLAIKIQKSPKRKCNVSRDKKLKRIRSEVHANTSVGRKSNAEDKSNTVKGKGMKMGSAKCHELLKVCNVFKKRKMFPDSSQVTSSPDCTTSQPNIVEVGSSSSQSLPKCRSSNLRSQAMQDSPVAGSSSSAKVIFPSQAARGDDISSQCNAKVGRNFAFKMVLEFDNNTSEKSTMSKMSTSHFKCNRDVSVSEMESGIYTASSLGNVSVERKFNKSELVYSGNNKAARQKLHFPLDGVSSLVEPQTNLTSDGTNFSHQCSILQPLSSGKNISGISSNKRSKDLGLQPGLSSSQQDTTQRLSSLDSILNKEELSNINSEDSKRYIPLDIVDTKFLKTDSKSSQQDSSQRQNSPKSSSSQKVLSQINSKGSSRHSSLDETNFTVQPDINFFIHLSGSSPSDNKCSKNLTAEGIDGRRRESTDDIFVTDSISSTSSQEKRDLIENVRSRRDNCSLKENTFDEHVAARRHKSIDIFHADSDSGDSSQTKINLHEILQKNGSNADTLCSENKNVLLQEGEDTGKFRSFNIFGSFSSAQEEQKTLFKRSNSCETVLADDSSNCSSSTPGSDHDAEEEKDQDSDDNRGIYSFYNETMIGSLGHENTTFGIDIHSQLVEDEQKKSQDHEQLCAYSFGSKEGSLRCRVYTPRYKPPTIQEIMSSLPDFNIPEFRHQEPFVSSVLDSTDRKVVGNRVLKIQSKSVADLEPFTSGLENITGIETWRKYHMKEFLSLSQQSMEVNKDFGYTKCILASHREVIITPCKLPPSHEEVKVWLQKNVLMTKSNPEESVIETEATTIKMTVPLSPGQEMGSDDDDVSLSIGSPLTPRSQEVKESQSEKRAKVHSTPEEASVTQRLSSPLYTPIHETGWKKMHPLKRLIKRSRKELYLNSPIQENVSPSLPSIREEDDGIGKLDDTASLRSTGEADACPIDNQLVEENASSCQSLETTAHPCNSEVPPNAAKTPRFMKRLDSSCQIEGSTPNNTYGFRMSFENLQDVKAVSVHQFLTTFILELHFQTRGGLRPNPEYDPIRAVFYVVVNDVPDDSDAPKSETCVIVVRNLDGNVKIPPSSSSDSSCRITYVDNEASLLEELVKRVKQWDPDILAGYEVEMLSWGYLFQRAYKLEMNLYPLISRIPSENLSIQPRSEKAPAPIVLLLDEFKLAGRIVLDVWRLMRHEVALQSYTFESISYHILHHRIPLHSFKQLTFWWEHKTHLYRWMCIDHYLTRVRGIVMLLDQLDLIGRTSELARLFGIQFLEVLSRGSQFRVESMMLRLAKPLNYVPVSPSVQQRAKMRAPESLPLIMEPNSRFYADPVIVLDFQSLYPSIIIAYNYCFSTCLGRVEHLGQSIPYKFGCTQLRVSPAQLLKLEKNINISPVGIAFVNGKVRKGVIPRMLTEILDTRLMVKKSMKEHKSNKTLQRVLHSRQLGLKLIANVTYGYTSANFSGRMPCIEVGDSVVSKGRETLERAIHLVESTPRWGAQVVYGDTDSMFVLVPGKSREQAFKIGAEIAEAVTADNPKPVKLKLEKVYQPCILQTKKRYVGYMYESPYQEKPVYEAKGIETVRRDGCPAVAKILEKSLRLIFETKNVSLVKNYVCRQFTKIFQGRLNFQDLIFAREYRGMSGYRPGACVPALELTRRWLQTDKRAEPRQSERVPYIIVNGPPGLPLIRLVRSPHELLSEPSLRPNATYYITRVIIPPLDRCFSLLGADVNSWYNDMPRKFIMNLPTTVPDGTKKCTISQHFATMNCAVCSQLTNTGICAKCQKDPQNTAVVLANKVQLWERTYSNITKMCQSCCRRSGDIECISLDCPVLFRRNQASRDMSQTAFIRNLQEQYLHF